MSLSAKRIEMMLRSLLCHRKDNVRRIIPISTALDQYSNCHKRWTTSSSENTSAAKDVGKKYSFLHDLPPQFLRDSSLTNFDEITSQRNDVHFNNDTGKPEMYSSSSIGNETNLTENSLSIENYCVNENECKILWSDGKSSFHDTARLTQQYLSWKRKRPEDRILWESLTEQDVRASSDLSISFKSLVFGDVHFMSKAIKTLYQYGILLVTKTPTNDNGAGIAALGAALSGGSVKNNPTASLLANYRSGRTDVVLPSATDGPLRTMFGGGT